DSSQEGAVLLKSFLNWLVLNTKQENCFHAVLTSSDSFFLNWIIVLSKRSKYHFGIVVIPEGHEFAYRAHHEANTSPHPITLSYENTIVWDLRELISSSLKTLEVEEENR